MKLFIFLILATNLYALDHSEFEKKAKAILKPIKKDFMREMKQGLKKGPYEGLQVCHLKAPHILEGKYNDKYKFGRSSHKIRNPQNAPEPWLSLILEDYKNTTSKKPKLPKTYQVHNKLTYVEPIYIKSACLQCHGNVSKSVTRKLKELYPHDEATGFKLGQFRGLFWIQER